MHVEHQPGDVAHNEHGHDDHQHDEHAVLLHPPPLPPSADGQIYFSVEEGYADEREYAKNKQSGPVDIISHIVLIQPEGI